MGLLTLGHDYGFGLVTSNQFIGKTYFGDNFIQPNTGAFTNAHVGGGGTLTLASGSTLSINGTLVMNPVGVWSGALATNLVYAPTVSAADSTISVTSTTNAVGLQRNYSVGLAGAYAAGVSNANYFLSVTNQIKVTGLTGCVTQFNNTILVPYGNGTVWGPPGYGAFGSPGGVDDVSGIYLQLGGDGAGEAGQWVMFVGDTPTLGGIYTNALITGANNSDASARIVGSYPVKTDYGSCGATGTATIEVVPVIDSGTNTHLNTYMVFDRGFILKSNIWPPLHPVLAEGDSLFCKSNYWTMEVRLVGGSYTTNRITP